MAFRYILLEGGNADLKRIVKFLSVDLSSPSAAASFANSYEKTVSLVIDFPEMYPLSSYDELAELGYRYFLVKKYVVLYKVIKDMIFVAHIFHGLQDYTSLVVSEDDQVFGSIEVGD